MAAKTVTPVKLEGDLRSRLDAAATRLGVTRTQLMTESLRVYLALIESGQCVIPDSRAASRLQGATR